MYPETEPEMISRSRVSGTRSRDGIRPEPEQGMVTGSEAGDEIRSRSRSQRWYPEPEPELVSRAGAGPTECI